MLLVLIVYRVCGDLGRITLSTDYLEREKGGGDCKTPEGLPLYLNSNVSKSLLLHYSIFF